MDERAAAPGWLADLAGLPGRGPLPPLRAASLLLLDLQRLFVDPVSPAFLPAWPAAEAGCRTLLAAFRSRGLPVIWTRHVHPPGDAGGVIARFGGRPLRADDPLAALCWEPAPGEPVLLKARYSPWLGTGLDGLVPAGGVVVVAGVTTHRCVLSAGVEAASRDRLAVVVADATATRSGALQRAALACLAGGFAWVAGAGEVLEALGG
jgi:nicotinamidase-related amidase